MSQSVRPILRVFWQHARRYPLLFVVIVTLIIFANVINIYLPTFYKRLVDQAASGLPATAMTATLLGTLAVIMGAGAAKFISYRTAAFCNSVFQPSVMADLERSAFSHLLDHSYRFFSNEFAGSLVRKVGRLSRSFETVFDKLVWEMLGVVIITVGMTALFWSRAPILAVVTAIWIVLFIAINYAVSRWKLRYDEQRAHIDSQVTGALADAISNAVTVKQFVGGEHERNLFRAITEKFRKIQTFTWNLGEINDAVQFLLMLVLELVVLSLAIRLFIAGTLTLGDFILIQTALSYVFDRLRDFGRLIRHLYEAFADAREMIDIMDAPHEVVDRKGAKKLTVTQGAIAFTGVTFSYNEKRPILSNFSLTIAAHEKVAFVGSSGAGKSTITKLLLRMFDVMKGTIAIDGQNIAKMTQDSLRAQVALVPQDPVLFHRSLMDNIRYGRRDATDAEVMEAAKQAHCDEFIHLLPQGYATMVGERGVKLSGGERQRVAIARAILKNAPVLLLDEATSSLDSESEALIQDALRQLMRNKTVIVIAHRLSTIMLMDRIVVIEKGAVADTGTHAELLQREGTYKKLWSIQAGGFLP